MGGTSQSKTHRVVFRESSQYIDNLYQSLKIRGRSLTIIDFMGFGKIHIQFTRFHYIVGPNGAGKTNALRALLVLLSLVGRSQDNNAQENWTSYWRGESSQSKLQLIVEILPAFVGDLATAILIPYLQAFLWPHFVNQNFDSISQQMDLEITTEKDRQAFWNRMAGYYQSNIRTHS